MTRNIRQVIILICLLVLSPMACPVFATTVAIPNSHHWDSYSPWTSVYGGSSIDSSQSAPGSSSGALRFRYPTGFHVGNAPDKVWVNFTPISEIWVQYWAKYSGNFDFRQNGHKHAYWKLSGSATNFFIYRTGDPGDPDGNMAFIFQRTGSDHVSGIRYSNGPHISAGVWYKFTIHAVLNTGENANGVFQLWVNDQQVINSSNIPYLKGSDVGKQIGSMEFTPVWGSQSGDVKPAEDYFWVDCTTISNDPIGVVPTSGGKNPEPPSNLGIR